MKKISSLSIITIMLLAVASCKNGGKVRQDSTDSAEAAEGAAHSQDSITASQATKNDINFINIAADDGMAEVAVGKIAQKKAFNPKVKKFATMMVTDHSRVNNELATLAKEENITLPLSPDTASQRKAGDLEKKHGTDFDNSYVNAMLAGHEGAVKLFTNESENGKDPNMKAFAIRTLPTLIMHLNAIKQVKADMQ